MTPNNGPELLKALLDAGYTEEQVTKMSLQEARNALWEYRDNIARGFEQEIKSVRAASGVKGNPKINPTSFTPNTEGLGWMPEAEKYGGEVWKAGRAARKASVAAKEASLGGRALGWWKRLPAWGRLGIKGAGGVLGGLGLLTTAMEIPDMLRTGRDVAEDMGFDPTGRRADAKTRLANEMNWRSRESDPLTVALLGQEQLNSDLAGLENFERADVPGPSDRSIALRDQALLRKLQIDHEEELEQLRGKAVRTDELEDAFHRLMGTR